LSIEAIKRRVKQIKMISFTNVTNKYRTKPLKDKIRDIENELFAEGNVVFLCADLDGQELEDKKDEIRIDSVDRSLLVFEETLRNDGEWNEEGSLAYDSLRTKISDYFQDIIEGCFNPE